MRSIFIRIVKKFRKIKRYRLDAEAYANLKLDIGFLYFFDLYERYKKYGKRSLNWDEESVLSELLVVSHTIEKGLTTPNCRLGFGEEKVNKLITLLETLPFEKVQNEERCYIAIRTFCRYVLYHYDKNYQLPERVNVAYAKFANLTTIENLQKNVPFLFCQGDGSIIQLPFADFAKLRRSVRFYSDKPINEESIQDAIRLAQTAPSTCNRQSTKVMYISNKEKINEVLGIHSGCRSFANNIPALLLLYSDLRDWEGDADFFGPYLDGGVFLMNLLYGLEFYSIGACPLNAYFSKDNENSLRGILGLHQYEIPVVLIACGLIAIDVDLPLSERRPFTEIYKKI